MSAPRHRSEWLYSQIYFHDPQRVEVPLQQLCNVCDQLLVPTMQQWLTECFAHGWLERFFFIRYGEGGYHLRLRLKGRPEHLYGPVRASLEALISDFFDRFRAPLRLADRPLTPETLREMERLRYAAYEPEYTKYGGLAGIDLAEQHFEVSSRLCFQVLEAAGQSGIGRSQFALELMDIALSAYGATPLEKAFILRSYTGFWLEVADSQHRDEIAQSSEANYQQHKEKLVRRFQAGGAGALERSWSGKEPRLFDYWREHIYEQLQQLRQLEREGKLDAPLSEHVVQHQALLQQVPEINKTPTVALLILPNYIHMLNNRLGLSPLHEIQLTHLLYRYFEERYSVSAQLYPLILEPELAIANSVHGSS